ncbi:MAG TPA: ABC transporter substrate-binding protein [Streptosporangiaceae bacterium]
MKRRRIMGVTAFGAVAALALAACSSSPSGGGGTATGFNVGVTHVVNPSNHKGGTLNFASSAAIPDSADPGNTSYAQMWNLTRLYTMPLMTYASCPGACGLRVVPMLATGPGVVSDNGLTWTYHIKPNVHFEDGTLVTSADVKYAVERTYDRGKFPLGPAYYPSLLAPQKPAYPGPYKDRSKNLMGLKAVETPNSTTVVFHLAKPFADFNYVTAIPQSAPVPPSKDTGANYQLHPMSTGPYMFQSYQINKQLTLVPNPHWNPATDPNAKQLPSKIVLTFNVNPNDVDNRLLAGDIQVDLPGTGVQAAARTKILTTPSLKAHSDNPVSGFEWFMTLNNRVPPMNNIHCRIAVEYAANKVDNQTAYGGPYAGGAIASTASPPNVVGHKPFDLYEATTKPQGDLTKAKQQLQACGHPNGFSTGITYRSDRPKEVAVAQAMQAALARVGIKLTLHGFPTASYTSNFAGVPNYVHSHGLGITVYGWAPDWPDGYGEFYYIAAGAAISPVGNTNLGELNDPVVNSLLDKFATTADPAVRNSYTSQIDRQIMKDAAFLPIVYAKALLYRSPRLTNVYVQPYYGMYNYAVLGLK